MRKLRVGLTGRASFNGTLTVQMKGASDLSGSPVLILSAYRPAPILESTLFQVVTTVTAEKWDTPPAPLTGSVRHQNAREGAEFFIRKSDF